MSGVPIDLDSELPLIVVSNRLPFVLKREPVGGVLTRKSSAGGLVTAVAPVVVKSGGKVDTKNRFLTILTLSQGIGVLTF